MLNLTRDPVNARARVAAVAAAAPVPNLSLYADRDQPYIQAAHVASALLHRGDIKAYAVCHERGVGNFIEILNDDGWDPTPLFRATSQPLLAAQAN